MLSPIVDILRGEEGVGEMGMVLGVEGPLRHIIFVTEEETEDKQSILIPYMH